MSASFISNKLPESERKVLLEKLAAIIGRRCSLWTLHFRPFVQWPGDYTEDEKKMFREAASEVLESLKIAEATTGEKA